MRRALNTWVARSDGLVMIATLAVAIISPITFLVPYNDEWLRMNYLADHSVWQWTVMHVQTWVVRPTAELIMALASAQTTRPALGAHADAELFLARFHAPYLALVLGLFALMAMLATALAPKHYRFTSWSVSCGCLWLCIAASDELGYAFYWADGYANVVLPFFGLLLALALFCRDGALAHGGAALCMLGAALGHEVLCIYASGFVLLQLLRTREHPRSRRALFAALLCGLLAILYAQGFSQGPAQRTQAYLEKTGTAYNWTGALAAVRLIDPKRTAGAFLATLALIAGSRARLRPIVLRAEQHARAHPWYWLALAFGALLTSVIPLASVGLKKASVIVGAYSVATELFVILAAALSYPLLARWLEYVFAPYRNAIVTTLPVLMLALWLSPNLASYQAAFSARAELSEQASAYMQKLFAGKGKSVRTTRPCHAFIKPASGMTMRNAKQYFALARFKERDCKRLH